MASQQYYSEQIGLPKTDSSLWRLRVSELGATNWEYISEERAKNDPQSPYVQYLLEQDSFERPHYEEPALDAFELAKRGATFLNLLQDKSGILPNQYKGPMFMAIGYVASCYFCQIEIKPEVKTELIRYIVNTSHPVDGGWGLHSVDKSTCFGTAINYVILRILGLPKDHPVCVKARKTLLRLGGAIAVPHWGKAWLSILNLYKWEGVNPAPPELWSLPYLFPIHPAKWWVHTRAIYLPLLYLSSYKLQCELDPLLELLRLEIYVKPFDSIDFSKHRDTVCGVDLYYPHTTVLNVLNKCIVLYQDWIRPNWLLKKSNDRIYELVKAEMTNTKDLTIAPVSAAFDLIVLYMEEGRSKDFHRAAARFKDVMFHGPQGMAVMGTNGSQVWDISFAVQYMFMAGLAELPQYREFIVRAYKFLIRSQFTEECVEGSFRDKRVGAWPFSTKEQGYTVSDCTAEAMKAIIMVKKSSLFKDYHTLYDDTKLRDGVDVLLSLQNVGSFEFGAFSTYEMIKATPLLEMINPAEVFANIMVEYPYVECTDSSVLGLTYFRKYYDYRSEEVETAIDRAIQYIVKAQNPDGSWYGCWGICYTYAGMFALEALSTIERFYDNDETVKKGCDFLVSRQRPDGGWGESMKVSNISILTIYSIY